jgi:hypothetical protein
VPLGSHHQRRAAAYAGISLPATRALTLNGWAAGIVIACGLMVFAPPTAQLGAAGWIAGIGIQALSLVGWAAFRRRPEAVTFGTLLVELAVWALVIGSLSVLMERIRGQARLARSDPLTRLGNRGALEEQFEAPGTAVTALGVGDIDDFTRINDRHGHLAGDACLTSVADTLAEHGPRRRHRAHLPVRRPCGRPAVRRRPGPHARDPVALPHMRSGLFLPLFDPLADPALVARLASEAEEAGWEGVFVWDHVRWREPVVEVADPWITLAAIAAATASVRLGPMVTPLARRRPVKVARETATLDRLSGGRLTLGVGLGSDEFGSEYSMTGEEVDDKRRARMLDESLEILAAAWSGEPVHHRSEHYTLDGMRFLPRPVQRPGVPVWVAGFYGKPRPLRRAARHQGFFPVNLEHPEQLAEIVAQLTVLREEAGKDAAEPYDVVAALAPGDDPAPYAEAGATWWVVDFPGDAVSVDQIRGVIRDGPFGGSATPGPPER